MPIDSIDTTLCELDGGRVARTTRSYSPGDITFNPYRWDQDGPDAGSDNAKLLSLIGEDSGGSYLWGYHIYVNDTVGQSPAQVSFTQNEPAKYEAIQDTSSPFTSLVKFQDYTITLRDPSSDLAFIVDGTVEHVDGGAYTNTDRLKFRYDDSYHRVKSQDVILSTFIFESGKAVELTNATQTFVNEDKENELVNDGGDSSYSFINGTGIGREN